MNTIKSTTFFKKVTYLIEGASPLMMASPKGLETPNNGPTKPVIPDPETQAEMYCYRLPNGELYFPTVAVRKCLLTACKGKKLMKRAAWTVMAGVVFPADDYSLLLDKKGKPITKYEIDTRRCVVKNMGRSASILVSRPLIKEWQLLVNFNILHDQTADGDKPIIDIDIVVLGHIR